MKIKYSYYEITSEKAFLSKCFKYCNKYCQTYMCTAQLLYGKKLVEDQISPTTTK